MGDESQPHAHADRQGRERRDGKKKERTEWEIEKIRAAREQERKKNIKG